MAIIIPEEFRPLTAQEETTPQRPRIFERPAQKQPSRAKLLRAMENIDFAKSQADQDTIAREIGRSTKKAISPELLISLENRYGIRRKAGPSPAQVRAPVPADEIRDVSPAGPLPVAGGPTRVPLSSVTPLRMGGRGSLPEPAPVEVFQNQDQFDEVVKEAQATAIPFGEERLALTDLEVLGEMPENYFAKLKAMEASPKVDKLPPGVKEGLEGPWDFKAQLLRGPLKEDDIRPPERVISEFEKVYTSKGAKVRKGVNTSNIREDVIPGVEKVLDAYKAIGVKEPEITSALRVPETLGRKDEEGDITKSFHLMGRAVDFGWTSLSPRQRAALKKEFNKLGDHGKTQSGNDIWTFGGKWIKGHGYSGYQLIIHDEGYGTHVHIEYDTVDTKAELNAHMAKRNK